MHSSHIRVTIGLPVFNGEPYLEEAIESILSQSFTDFELIIGDNASTDNTEAICRSYAERDDRVRYYRSDENRGAAWNYNRLVPLAHGEYFKWAAHDDLLAPGYLAACVKALDAAPQAVLAYPRTAIIDEHGHLTHTYDDDLDLRMPRASQRFWGHMQVFRRMGECNAIFGLMRTDVLRTTGLIGPYVGSDMILLGELALRGEFHEIPERLFMRRDHPQTSIRSNPNLYERSSWFDPAARQKPVWPRWRWLAEYIYAIRRSELSPLEALRCYMILSRWMRWHKDELSYEARYALKARLKRYDWLVHMVRAQRRARRSIRQSLHRIVEPWQAVRPGFRKRRGERP